MIDMYMRIAFADMADFGTLKKGKFIPHDLELVDGQLIKAIKQSPHGTMIELIDKLPALKKLEEYFDFMPKDWKQELEEKKLKLLEQKLEIEKVKAGMGDTNVEDDGFLQALYESADSIWEDNTDESESDQ